ncbi:MAG: transglycosylase SLT domain-containing protein [Leptonema sp. (in: Bacteria)]|nr:transglycosylase SLT domain-containing protein [Leptonema sp. (in: bacteria)]
MTKKSNLVVTLSGLTALGMVNIPEPANLDPTIWQKKQTQPDIKFLADHIRQTNPKIEAGEENRLARNILQESKFLRVPETAKIDGLPINQMLFITAVIETESTFRGSAISYANARGYMQIMPATMNWIKDREGLSVDERDIHETEVNLMLGVRYLSYLFDEFKEPHLVALAYNAGPGNLRRGIYDIRYWNKVAKFYRILNKKRELLKPDQN